jgi:ABC-type transport system involved in cytochrome c biogenesis permease component
MDTQLQYTHFESHSIGVVPVLIGLGVAVFMIASMWKIFTKAGKPGWASIIPIYNTIVMLEIARKPVWWIVLFLIPGVSLIMMIITMAALANNFGKGSGFVLGMIFLPVIFFPILGFGSAQYIPAGMPQPYGIPQARAYY